ncbi:acyl carrier protein [Ferruginibacter paludis]|uniref:acyl carrier protein n=1 Tax=Ferruginibacter paludis TaxID=1310417 RepID=UPI0025B316B1|nr:acyl carrier protein [Ferruginibacter paludis]MDN3657624.1 acyl carrier protein [Ferruginibacter paludis]
MEKPEILAQLNTIFIDIADNENIRLNEMSSAGNVEGWDSLTHIQLVVAIEKYFKIRFTSKEIQSWKNVGELMDSIAAKVSE